MNRLSPGDHLERGLPRPEGRAWRRGLWLQAQHLRPPAARQAQEAV